MWFHAVVGELPELVHVPIRSADPEATETVVELRILPEGTTVAVAYTSRESVVACCGDAQPWMLIPLERLADLAEVLGFDQILLDVPVGGSGDAGR